MSHDKTRGPAVFLSYANADRPDVERVYEALHARGLKVFVDSEAIAPGESFQKSIADAISQSAAVVVFISPDYLSSTWCQFETELALKTDRPLIPVLVRGDISDSTLKHLNHLDYIHLEPRESRDAEAAKQIENSLKLLTTPEPPDETGSLDAGGKQ